MTDVAGWWKRRENARSDIAYDRPGGKVHAESYLGSEDVCWSIQLQKDEKFVVAVADLREGIQLDRLDQYKKIRISEAPFPRVGEVAATSIDDDGWIRRCKAMHRSWQRKRRMVRELGASRSVPDSE
jgi:hypothetical protein